MVNFVRVYVRATLGLRVLYIARLSGACCIQQCSEKFLFNGGKPKTARDWVYLGFGVVSNGRLALISMAP